MNIFKNKHWAMAVSAIVLFVFFIHTPLQAGRARRGSMVVVTMIDGSQVKGELLAVKSDILLVYDRDASQGKSLDLQQVTQVKVLKKSKFLLGLAIGTCISIATIAIANSILPSPGPESYRQMAREMKYFLFMPIPMILGGYLGAEISSPKKFYMSVNFPRIMQKNLEQFKRYAREQDFEKPAAD